MGKNGGKKLQTMCVNRIRPLVKVATQNKLGSSPSSVKKTNVNDKVGENNNGDHHIHPKFEEESGKLLKENAKKGRKIMVVVDSSTEAKIALQWTLTHTVQNHDLIVLLYVAKLNTNTTNQGLYCSLSIITLIM